MMWREKELQGVASGNLSEEKQPFTSLISKKALIGRLTIGPEARVRFVESHLNKGLAFQIRGLRNREDWSQQNLADKLNSNQNAVSRLENPNYGRPTITTLKKIAAVFDVALVVRFVPFSQIVDWVTGTPHTDPGLTPETLDVPSFQTELDGKVFEEPKLPLIRRGRRKLRRSTPLRETAGVWLQDNIVKISEWQKLPSSGPQQLTLNIQAQEDLPKTPGGKTWKKKSRPYRRHCKNQPGIGVTKKPSHLTMPTMSILNRALGI